MGKAYWKRSALFRSPFMSQKTNITYTEKTYIKNYKTFWFRFAQTQVWGGTFFLRTAIFEF